MEDEKTFYYTFIYKMIHIVQFYGYMTNNYMLISPQLVKEMFLKSNNMLTGNVSSQ